MNNDLTITAYGEHAVLLAWKPEIAEEIHFKVMQFEDYIRVHHQKAIRETIVTYHSLLIHLKAQISPQEFIRQLRSIRIDEVNKQTISSNLYEIPVLYDTSVGLDLESVASQKNISTHELIQLHTQPIYKVYFIGFLPGFPYLGGLIEKLHTPRKAVPRSRVEAGSVAIGGNQTGVYPQDSPGGWNIIGRTPITLFDLIASEPSFLKAGDRVQFRSIDKSRFEEIQYQIDIKNFVVTKTEYHG
jgi:inhibitor of KinA